MDGTDVYRRLQKHIDNMPVGFPATESGVELRILKRLFTPEEAEVGLLLSAVPEDLERIHRRTHISEPLPPGNKRKIETLIREELQSIFNPPAIISNALHVEL